MVRILYIFKLMFRGMRRRPWGTLFTFIAWWFALCQLIMVSHTVMIAKHVRDIRGTTSTMIAYIEDRQQQPAIDSIKSRISSMGEVSDVVFIPRDSGLDRLKKWLGEDNPLIDGLDPKVLPDAFEITVQPLYAGQIESIVRKVRGIHGIEDVRYDRGILGYVADAYQSILISGGMIASIVIISLCLLIFLTIRVSIVMRRQEIEVMNLLGAHGFFLFAPYLLEALMYGMVGALLALVSMEGALQYILSRAPALRGILSMLQLREIIILAASSSCVSLLGAYMAIRQSIDG